MLAELLDLADTD